jgi:hypothetical protein
MTHLASTILAAATLLACQDPGKAPAAAALQAAESSLSAVRDEAGRFAPEQLKGVITELDAARAAFAAGKYADALASARPLGDRIAALGRESSDRRNALLVNWASLSASVPEALGVVGGLVDELTSMPRPPQGIDASALASVRETLAAARTAWDAAQVSFRSGALVEAVQLAQPLPEKIQSAADRLAR